MRGSTAAVLAVDIGSSAVRTGILDMSGRLVAEHRSERHDIDAGLTFDPEVLWKQVTQTIQAVTTTHGRVVEGIAVAGHVGTVFLDSALTPVGPARGWADSAGVERLTAELEGRNAGTGTLAEVLHATGRPALSGGGLPALLELRHLDPHGFGRVRHVVQPKDYVIARMTGQVVTDHTSAAYTGASVVRDRCWDDSLLAHLGVDRALFPRQVRATDQVGELSPGAGRNLSLPTGTPVFAGGPDGTVGATLVLGPRTDTIADVAGTTDVLVRVLDQPTGASTGTVLNPYTLEQRWTIGGPTGMTGGAVSWFTHLLGLGSPSQAIPRLWSEITAVGPGAGGVTVHPGLSGSRFPRWDAEDRGCVRGLSPHHSTPHLMRAVLEGVAYVVREGVDALADGDGEMSIVLAGGSAKSPELSQLRADILGCPVDVCAEPDVSLKGAAMLALLGTHALDPHDAHQLAGDLRRYVPNPTHADAYTIEYARWQTQMPRGSA